MKTYRYTIKKAMTVLLGLVLMMAFAVPANAQEDEKTVRVGWYDSSFNSMDSSMRRSGYAYEYQMKVAAYTKWTYEYINGSWSELMEMLENGEIDLMSDVSYTKDREDYMFFSSLPMGSEEYYLFIPPGNASIIPSDLSTLNGKRVGVNKGSVQAGFYEAWAQRNGIASELVEVTGSENDSLEKMENGELDAYVTVDSFTDPQRAIPVCKIGSSDFYFAVNKKRPDLLQELNIAMSRIQEENRYYNLLMFDKYYSRISANAFLNESELAWLSSHPKIRIGYQDNYLALCAADKETGELTGALKDFLAFATEKLENASLDFEAIAYQTSGAAIEALQKGEVDCIFPINISDNDGEKIGLVITDSLVDSEIYAMVNASEQSIFANKEHVIVAVNQANPNYDSFLLDSYPSWVKVYYPDTTACLEAVSKGVADCVLISQYRYNNIARQCNKLRITPLATGKNLQYCFAVGKGNTELYSILAKTVGLVPKSSLTASLTYYIAEEAKPTISDIIEDHLPLAMSLTASFLALVLALLFFALRSARKAKSLISATESDPLTGLLNHSYFLHYANRMHQSHPENPMDAMVINIEHFHSIIALNGRKYGDQVLQALGQEITSICQERDGIASRFEADRFDIYCRHSEDYQAIYNRLQSRLDSMTATASLRLRMGVMPWKEGLKPEELLDQAHTASNLARYAYQEHLVVFNEKVAEREKFEQTLLADLKRDLDDFAFEVYYQPKYDIQSDPPKLISAEALVRWRHPELGIIMPKDFIPVLEKNGRIFELDKYVWNQAARQIAAWREEYGVIIQVSVNLSRVDVFDPTLAETLENTLSYYQLDHKALKLEVTESMYVENASRVFQVIDELRGKGYVVELDDFGTGYSSMNNLSAIPIDVLKMDKDFVQNISQDEKGYQMVAMILDIAKNLGIPVVAEGVETEEQMNLLKSLGCSIAQGYFFSRPLSAPDFEKTFIQDNASFQE